MLVLTLCCIFLFDYFNGHFSLMHIDCWFYCTDPAFGCRVLINSCLVWSCLAAATVYRGAGWDIDPVRCDKSPGQGTLCHSAGLLPSTVATWRSIQYPQCQWTLVSITRFCLHFWHYFKTHAEQLFKTCYGLGNIGLQSQLFFLVLTYPFCSG